MNKNWKNSTGNMQVLIPKTVPSTDYKPEATVGGGPRKPKTLFKVFYAGKENRHKNDPDFDRTELMDCKEQWRNSSDKKNGHCNKKPVPGGAEGVYIGKYELVPTNIKTVLTKEEKNLKEMVAGKPEKPLSSGYNLFWRIVLVSPEIRQVSSKKLMSLPSSEIYDEE
jgi:hypothetical protein